MGEPQHLRYLRFESWNHAVLLLYDHSLLYVPQQSTNWRGVTKFILLNDNLQFATDEHSYEAEPVRVYRTALVAFHSGIGDCLWLSNIC